MSTTYKIEPGDTFENISRKAYGYESEALRIAQANPGLSVDLTPGTFIIVPDLPGAPVVARSQVSASNVNEVSVLIDGTRFRFWDSLRLIRKLDGIDTVELSAPFEPDAPGFRETFQPFSFKPLEVYVGDAPLFTGIMVDVAPVLANDVRTISVSAYSAPGVLNDCTSPASAFPLEYDGLTLREIATAALSPFGIAVEFETEAGPIFERVKILPTKRIFDFLTDLAGQRNFIATNTELGALRFLRAVSTGSPVAAIAQGASPVLSVTPLFNPQQYFSHVTGLESVAPGKGGSQYTVKNPHLDGVLRPLTFHAPDSTGSELPVTVETKTGRMFGAVASYSVQVDTWRDPSGALWLPNTTLTLSAPGAMVYTDYEFIIRSVEFSRDRAKETAILNLVLPGTFSGELPEALPWG